MKASKRDLVYIIIGVLVGSLFFLTGMEMIENHSTACFVSFVGGLMSFFVPLVLINNFNPRGSSGDTKGESRG